MSQEPTARPLGAEAPGQTFPKSSRLLRRSEFQKVQERGLRNAGTALVLFAYPNETGRRRLGLTVSKRVGNAVCRVRVKRLLRDIFRKERGRLPASIDLVVIARSPAARSDRAALLKEFVRAAGYFRKRLAAPPPACQANVPGIAGSGSGDGAKPSGSGEAPVRPPSP